MKLITQLCPSVIVNYLTWEIFVWKKYFSFMRIFKVFILISPFSDLRKEQDKMTKNTFFITNKFSISLVAFTFQRSFCKKPWHKTTLRHVLLLSSLVVKCQIKIARKQRYGALPGLFLCLNFNRNLDLIKMN